MKPVGFFSNGDVVEESKKIILTFSSPPTSAIINKAFYRYNKKFVYSCRFDDGYLDAYHTAFKLFGGGDVIHEDGVVTDYPGLYYTDGCGNNIPFKGSIAVNSGTIDLSKNPTFLLNYKMINEMYVEGWGIWNTGKNDFGGGTDFEDLIDDAARYQKALDEILLGEDEIKQATSIKVKNWTAPFNSDFYDGPSYSLFLDGRLKLVNNIDGITNTDLFNNGASETVSTQKSWESWLLNPYIGPRYDFSSIADNNITRLPNVDTDFIQTIRDSYIAGSYHPILCTGTHRVNLSETAYGASAGGSISPNFSGIFAQFRFLSFKHFYEEMQSRWGAGGEDSVWFTPMDDVYNFSKTRENSNISYNIIGNTIEINCDFSGVDAEYRDHDLSLLVDCDLDIVSIDYQGFHEQSHNIGYSGTPNTALINVSYKPNYELVIVERAKGNILVSAAENTQSQTDFDTAQDYVTSLRNGSFKINLQNRLDAIIIIPDSKVYQVYFGRGSAGYVLPFPWNNFDSDANGLVTGSILNNLVSTQGDISTKTLEITSSFSAQESNYPADTGSLPFPHEASRDCFKTFSGVPSVIQLQGCDPSKLYDFSILCGRGYVGTETHITIGGVTETVNHKTNFIAGNSSGNVTELINITNRTCDVNGHIDISILGVDGGSNDFGYINVLEITEKLP